MRSPPGPVRAFGSGTPAYMMRRCSEEGLGREVQWRYGEVHKGVDYAGVGEEASAPCV